MLSSFAFPFCHWSVGWFYFEINVASLAGNLKIFNKLLTGNVSILPVKSKI